MSYLIYLLPIAIISIYFELIGRAIAYKFKITSSFLYLPLGFSFILAISYIATSFLTFLNVNFCVVFFIIALICLISLIYALKNIKKIDTRLSLKNLCIVLVCSLFLLYYSYNTTLGNLDGFDTTFYLNLVSQNIGGGELNNINYLWGNTESWSIPVLYSFQSYYYFASCILFIFQKIYSFLGIAFYSITEFIWMFQVLFDISLVTLVCESISTVCDKYKKTLLRLLCFVFIIGFYGRYQFNNVYGFFGNSLKTITIGYSSLCLYGYIKELNKGYLYGLYVYLLANCALSSSGTFIAVLFLFAVMFIVLNNNDFLFKEYAVIGFFIGHNVIQSVFKNERILLSLALTTIMCLLLYICNNILIEFIKKYKKQLLVFVFILMLICSYAFTGNIVDMNSFWNNSGKMYDMVLYINSFDFYNVVSAKNLYLVYCLIILVINLIFYRKDNNIIPFWILIICFFNPLCCGFINSINAVYYRAYEIIINPFTIVMMTSNCLSLIENKTIKQALAVTFCLTMTFLNNPLRPMYYHESYIPNENYNKLYKMSNDEFLIIDELKNLTLDEENPKIVTANILTQSMLQKGTYIYGRTLSEKPDWTDAEHQVYAIFYPTSYYGDIGQPKDADFENAVQYLKEANIDYVVMNKQIDYYDKEQDIYYPLYLFIINDNSIQIMYENVTYILMKVDKN